MNFVPPTNTSERERINAMQIPPRPPADWQRRHRGGLQDGVHTTPEAVGHAMEDRGRTSHPRLRVILLRGIWDDVRSKTLQKKEPNITRLYGEEKQASDRRLNYTLRRSHSPSANTRIVIQRIAILVFRTVASATSFQASLDLTMTFASFSA